MNHQWLRKSSPDGTQHTKWLFFVCMVLVQAGDSLTDVESFQFVVVANIRSGDMHAAHMNLPLASLS